MATALAVAMSNPLKHLEIDTQHLVDVTGGAGRFTPVVQGARWVGRQADRVVTGLGIYELGRSAYDWAFGNSQPAQPTPAAPAAPATQPVTQPASPTAQ